MRFESDVQTVESVPHEKIPCCGWTRKNEENGEEFPANSYVVVTFNIRLSLGQYLFSARCNDWRCGFGNDIINTQKIRLPQNYVESWNVIVITSPNLFISTLRNRVSFLNRTSFNLTCRYATVCGKKSRDFSRFECCG